MKQNLKTLGTFIAGLLCLTGSYTAAAAGEPDPLLPADTPLQVIAADASTERTFSWQSSTAWHGSLEYREKDSSQIPRRAFASTRTIDRYDAEDINHDIYTVRLKNLRPDTTYEYRLRKAKPVTDWQNFKTPARNENHYKVLVFGDSQCTDYLNWGKTANAAYNNNQDAAFFIEIGDITDNGQAHFQWRNWFYNAKPLMETIPFAPVLGNHEAYTLSWKYADPDAYTNLFAVPENGPEQQNHLAYSFDYGNVHFASLNTDYEELHTSYNNMMENERDWLDQDLAKAKNAGKRLVVLMHRPPWTTASGTDLSIEGRTFLPLFDKYHVSLVFDGHLHVYSRTNPRTLQGESPKGTVYIMTGRSGDDIVNEQQGNDYDVKFYNPTDTTMYLTLEVEPTDFIVKAYLLDGSLLDSTVIKTS